MQKRGQNLTIGTIILIVLGIAVLVFLIFGFATGWTNLWSKITAFGGGVANVDTIKQACVLACNSGQINAYCTQKRTVNFGDDKKITGSCENLESDLTISCSEITCTDKNTYNQTCSDLGGEWKASCDNPIGVENDERENVDKYAKPDCCVKK